MIEIRGDFRLLCPATLLQALCQEQRNIRITAWCGAQNIEIDVIAGDITRASASDSADAEAVINWLGWSSGEFWVVAIEPPAEYDYLGDWEHLILEAARRRDEQHSISV
jgi:Domain of unknown function (DUF4388)